MSDLFDAKPRVPLAEALRPKTIKDVIGQGHLLGEGKPLRNAFDSGEVPSMILWGPPGVGKTTIARLMAGAFNCKFIPLSAVLAGVKDIRDAVEEAQIALNRYGKRTILFVDEIHRFNRTQQDALLPFVESGQLIFIGATTENPSFSLVSALLSRAHVHVLKSLSEDELREVYDRAASHCLAGFYVDNKAIREIIGYADGDARRLINMIELLEQAANLAGVRAIDQDLVSQALTIGARRFDKGRDLFHDYISAIHKSVRGSHPNAALYWFGRMLDGGCDIAYLSRRIVRMAWEDIGLADPMAIQIATAAAATYERLGSPEGELALAQAILYLASTVKSNAGYCAFNEVMAYVRSHGSEGVPMHLRNAPTKLMQDLGYHEGYRYAHDEPHAYAAGETHMPDGMDEPNWYQPVNRGAEEALARRLEWLRSLDAAAAKTGI